MRRRLQSRPESCVVMEPILGGVERQVKAWARSPGPYERLPKISSGRTSFPLALDPTTSGRLSVRAKRLDRVDVCGA